MWASIADSNDLARHGPIKSHVYAQQAPTHDFAGNVRASGGNIPAVSDERRRMVGESAGCEAWNVEIVFWLLMSNDKFEIHYFLRYWAA
jgi:hypothetical protein